MDAIVISRSSDTKRRERMERTLPVWLNWSFLDATDGRRPDMIGAKYGRLLPERHWGSTEIPPGVFGNFVSQYRAWEQCVKDNRPVLIFEDDVALNPAAENILSRVCIKDIDVLFMGKSTANWCYIYLTHRMLPFMPQSIRRKVALSMSYRHWPRMRSAMFSMEAVGNFIIDFNSGKECYPGAYSYLVTPTGAKSLLARADQYGAVVNIDWFIMGCGGLKRVYKPGADLCAKAVRFFSEPPLRIYANAGWLAEEISGPQGSIIGHNVTVDIGDYREKLGHQLAPNARPLCQ